MRKKWKMAGVQFDHMHMGDLLRLASEHPDVEIVGVCDDQPGRAEPVVQPFGIGPDRIWKTPEEMLSTVDADITVVCSSTGRHAEFVERVAPFGCHVLVEKPFADSLAGADRMIAAMQDGGGKLAINWPLAWYPCHQTAHRLVAEGTIGTLREVHYYDGNRGPLRHLADKVEVDEADAERLKSESWWYQRRHGGGSLQDYLGYGTTLGTWFLGGRVPVELSCLVDESPGLEVDEHAVVVARYESPAGLSKFETRWGTFTDPWTHQPQPKCGFVLVGTAGTIASYDYENTIRVQTVDCPQGRDITVDVPGAGMSDPIGHWVAVLEGRLELHGPLRPDLCRSAQRIVDAAGASASRKRVVGLAEFA